MGKPFRQNDLFQRSYHEYGSNECNTRLFFIVQTQIAIPYGRHRHSREINCTHPTPEGEARRARTDILVLHNSTEDECTTEKVQQQPGHNCKLWIPHDWKSRYQLGTIVVEIKEEEIILISFFRPNQTSIE
jgi:hypothetical protein